MSDEDIFGNETPIDPYELNATIKMEDIQTSNQGVSESELQDDSQTLTCTSPINSQIFSSSNQFNSSTQKSQDQDMKDLVEEFDFDKDNVLNIKAVASSCFIEKKILANRSMTMAIALPNGEQRLIDFTFDTQTCHAIEILTKAGVCNIRKFQVFKISGEIDLDYVVLVGNFSNKNEPALLESIVATVAKTIKIEKDQKSKALLTENQVNSINCGDLTRMKFESALRNRTSTPLREIQNVNMVTSQNLEFSSRSETSNPASLSRVIKSILRSTRSPADDIKTPVLVNVGAAPKIIEKFKTTVLQVWGSKFFDIFSIYSNRKHDALDILEYCKKKVGPQVLIEIFEISSSKIHFIVKYGRDQVNLADRLKHGLVSLETSHMQKTKEEKKLEMELRGQVAWNN